MHQTDLQVVTLRSKAVIVPQSVVGMLWLQMHFHEDDWKVLSEGSFLLTRAEAAMLVEDAEAAKLTINFD